MMKMQLDKMALIFLFVDGFGSLNMQIDTIFSSKSTDVTSFAFRHIVKKLSAKIHWHSSQHSTVSTVTKHLSEFKSKKHVGSITNDFESCQNEISAFTTRVNGCNFDWVRVVI